MFQNYDQDEKIFWGFVLFGVILLVGVLAYALPIKVVVEQAGGQVPFVRSLFELREKAATSNPALSEVEGWQTYTNEEFGFEVKYPNYIVSAEENIETASDLGLLARIEFRDTEMPFNIDVDSRDIEAMVDWVKQATLGHAADEIKIESRITKDRYEGVRLEFILRGPESDPRKEFSVIVINNGEYSFVINGINISGDLIDQILSTFRFIDDEL